MHLINRDCMLVFAPRQQPPQPALDTGRRRNRHSNEGCSRMVASLAVAINRPADELDFVRNALP
jgi:hypothetical protein